MLCTLGAHVCLRELVAVPIGSTGLILGEGPDEAEQYVHVPLHFIHDDKRGGQWMPTVVSKGWLCVQLCACV